MFIEERHQAILDHIKLNGRISIKQIQENFDISVDSARRDLRLLEEKGLLKRTHGGAISLSQVGITSGRYRDMKNLKVYDNYDAIAKKASEFVKENDVIYLTNGTFGFILLKYLPKNISYTLVVNSPTLADELKYWDNIDVYVIGGKMRMHGTTSIVDSLATSFVKNMHFDLSFLTGAGITAEFGISNGTDETATFHRAVIENTRKNILLMPNQKVGFNAFIKVCEVDKIHTLITDWDTIEEELNKIEEKGINVVIVPQK